MDWKKYGFRFLFALMIFGTLRLSDGEFQQYFDFSETIDKVLFVYTILVVFFIWEIIDRGFYYLKSYNFNFTENKNLAKAVIILTLISLPLVLIASSCSEYFIKPSLNCPVSAENYYSTIIQGQVFAWLIIAAKIIHLNASQTQQLEQDKAMVQKELLQSKYQNLKNQINPHFLFNSFSVLQNLIEREPEKASTFLEKLSTMYRYILEKREEAMSSLEKELEVLKVYLYLLKTRHEDSLMVNVDIKEEFQHSFVPTLSLQMLIENAVKHNRFSKDEPLVIDLFVEDDYLVVKNRLKRKGSIAQSTKIGLENIRNRYSLQTEKTVIVTEDDQFFTVKLPVLFGLKLT
ncbi:MAG: histidine kinase [Proteobacteria bacterium]|nr:histidine kinase [Pseudomonadota bacterium]